MNKKYFTANMLVSLYGSDSDKVIVVSTDFHQPFSYSFVWTNNSLDSPWVTTQCTSACSMYTGFFPLYEKVFPNCDKQIHDFISCCFNVLCFISLM